LFSQNQCRAALFAATYRTFPPYRPNQWRDINNLIGEAAETRAPVLRFARHLAE
jgi:hypothetical protein